MARRSIILPAGLELDLRRSLEPLVRGRDDPAIRLSSSSLARASRTPLGPATLLAERRSDRIEAEAWGPGASHALETLPALLGLDDDPTGFEPGRHPVIAGLARRIRGIRLGRTGAVLESLVPAIFEQKVTGTEARRAHRALLRLHGEPAPEPLGASLGLRVPPAPELLADLPYHAFHPLGIERRRAELVRRVARDAARLEGIASGPGTRFELGRRLEVALRAYAGIGPWTAAEVTLRALGDPDAVSVGDFHLPHLVTHALAGEPRGTDDRMLELLEPWRGHRARVIRLLEIGGGGPPRRGPRLTPRDIRGL